MDKNLKLLFLGLVIFLLSFILRMQNIISETLSNILIVISLIIVVIPLSRMVFKKRK
ncbi:hypothetical protein C8P70_1149 [Myroides indicus]|uniref:Uncharacterized protein n=1 Tax=Myroides indicus TaxID=1323422 RepID=A0A4V3E8M6_9FLAO|nr:hypothetical protein C8P70_1149 [Myroides indicus]